MRNFRRTRKHGGADVVFVCLTGRTADNLCIKDFSDNANLQFEDVPPDGNCFFHAYLYSVDPLYRDMDYPNRLQKALEIKKICLSTVLFCYENTGVYTMPLNYFLSKNALHYWVVPAIEIKRSKGISRGKSDKTDAKDIAFYAKTNLHKYNPISLPEKDIQELKILFTEREKLVECLKQMSTTIENEGFYNKDVLKSVLKINQTTIKNLQETEKM
jgi:hypothetical protein